eukprot:m.68739 g.68739  ORF g.68739 m.68739 type:complete len:294 (-) comp23986_c1_seq3:606-1487(-)
MAARMSLAVYISFLVAFGILVTPSAASDACQPCDIMGIASFSQCAKGCNVGGWRWENHDNTRIYSCMCAYPTTSILCDDACTSPGDSRARTNSPTTSTLHYYERINGTSINSLSACVAAAEYIGKPVLDSDTYSSFNDDAGPAGCYLLTFGGVYFNAMEDERGGSCSVWQPCICASSRPPPVPRTPPPSTPQYWRNTGICPFPPITSESECITGARNVGFSFRAMLRVTSVTLPIGCFGDTTDIWFNDAVTSTGTCSHEKRCLCARDAPPGYSPPTKPPTSAPSHPPPHLIVL